MLGNTLEAKKEYGKALSLITEAEEAVDLLQNIAQTFQYVDNYKIALRYLSKALELDESNLFIIQDIAYCYEKMEDPHQSLSYYQKYLDIDPFSENIWYSVGKLNQEMGQLEEAIEAFEYVIALNPESVDAIYEIATLYEDSFQYEKAIEYYKKYLKKEEETVEIYFYIANCFNYLDEYEDALNYYRMALKLDSYNAGIHHGIATILFKQKNHWDALFYAKRATLLDDEEYTYFVLYGRIASLLDLKNESLMAFGQAVELKPELLYNWVLYIDELIKYGYYKKSQKKLEECLEFHSESAYVYFRLAAVNYLEGNMKSVSRFFQEGMKIDQKQSKEFFKLCPKARKSKEISRMIKNLSYRNE
jgi:tetratricopeptide (TPR) repeat protein